MISKSQIKSITGLHQKKYRDKAGLFIAEGPKVISELIEEGLKAEVIYTTDPSLFSNTNTVRISEKDLQRISSLKTANIALGIFVKQKPISAEKDGLTVVLDAVRDPGNLGTIIRLCDWFGVSRLVCSPDTADCYNPKVVQATMGSIARVNISYIPLETFLATVERPVFGGYVDGNSVYGMTLPQDAVLVLGNEANGISETINKLLTHRIAIPQFGKEHHTESLNVATATAILLSEFRRTIGR